MMVKIVVNQTKNKDTLYLFKEIPMLLVINEKSIEHAACGRIAEYLFRELSTQVDKHSQFSASEKFLDVLYKVVDRSTHESIEGMAKFEMLLDLKS